MTGKAGVHQRGVARLAILKVAKPPPARRRVPFRVLDHELNIHGGPGDEGLSSREWTGEDVIVHLRGDPIPMQRCNDRAVRKRWLPFLERVDRDVVAELDAKLVDFTGQQLVYGDHLPVAISLRDLGEEDWARPALGP